MLCPSTSSTLPTPINMANFKQYNYMCVTGGERYLKVKFMLKLHDAFLTVNINFKNNHLIKIKFKQTKFFILEFKNDDMNQKSQRSDL